MNYSGRRWCGVVFIGVFSTMAMGTVQAAPDSIPFSISGPGVSATGTLTGDFVTLSGFSDIVFTVTGASGQYSDSSDGISGAITGVLPGHPSTAIPSNNNLNFVGSASYDNVVYPNGDSPVVCDPVFYPYHGGQLDIYGLLLTLDLTGGGTGAVNVWSNGVLTDPLAPIGLDYGVSDGVLGTDANGHPTYTIDNYIGNTNNYPANAANTGNYVASGVSFSTVPEPSALLMLGAGIAALPLLRLRRKNSAHLS